MLSSTTVRRLTILIPSSLAAVLTLALAAPGRAPAREPERLCAFATHAKHAPGACAHDGRRHGERGHLRAKRHHAKHAVTRKRPKKRAKPRPPAPSPSATAQPQPSCDDGSDPVFLGGAPALCGDGSEPTCEDGAEPVLANGGSALICPVSPGAGSGPAPAVCEDESAPVRSGDGSFSCGDESEPECADGSEPSPSSDGSVLICDLGTETGPLPALQSFDSTG